MYSKKERLRRLKLGLPPLENSAIATDAGIATASHSLAELLADKFNHNFDAYDESIDKVYNATHVGGSGYHHLLDGQHDFLSSFHAVKDVKADDSFITELVEAGEHLLRDTASISGINPFFSLTPEQFDNLADVSKEFGISKPFLADALTVNGPELLGGTIALISSIILAKKPDPTRLSCLSGAYLTSAAASANPVLLPIAAGGLVYSFSRANNKKEVIIKAGKGSFVSGSAILVGGFIGGPIWLGCIASVGTAIAVKYSIDNPEKAFSKINDLTKSANTVLREAILFYKGV